MNLLVGIPSLKLPPRKLTWNLKMMVSNRNLLFQGFIFRFHVCFPGCNRIKFGHFFQVSWVTGAPKKKPEKRRGGRFSPNLEISTHFLGAFVAVSPRSWIEESSQTLGLAARLQPPHEMNEIQWGSPQLQM